MAQAGAGDPPLTLKRTWTQKRQLCWSRGMCAARCVRCDSSVAFSVPNSSAGMWLRTTRTRACRVESASANAAAPLL